MIKGSVQEEYITIINVYTPNIEASQYIRQTLTDIKGETDTNTIIVRDFNTQLTPMDRSSKQKINKETQVLNNTLDKMDLIDIFRTFHPNAEEYTFFSSPHGAFSRIDHILGHKSNPMRCSKSSSKREVYSNTILPQVVRKTLNRPPNFTPKTTGKIRTTTKKKNTKLVEGKKS